MKLIFPFGAPRFALSDMTVSLLNTAAKDLHVNNRSAVPDRWTAQGGFQRTAPWFQRSGAHSAVSAPAMLTNVRLCVGLTMTPESNPRTLSRPLGQPKTSTLAAFSICISAGLSSIRKQSGRHVNRCHIACALVETSGSGATSTHRVLGMFATEAAHRTSSRFRKVAEVGVLRCSVTSARLKSASR